MSNSGDSQLVTFELLREEQHHPYSLLEIKQMLAEGVVTEASVARVRGQQVWRPLGVILETLETCAQTTPSAELRQNYPVPIYLLPIGRIGRLTWLLRNLAHSLTVVPFLVGISAVGESFLLLIVAGALLFVYVYLSFVTHAKRLHDLNQSAWLVLVLAVLPPLGLLLLFLDGSEGTNKYGARPEPFRTGLL